MNSAIRLKYFTRKLLFEILFYRYWVRILMILLSITATFFGLMGPYFQRLFIDHLATQPNLNELISAFVSILLSLFLYQFINFLGASEAIHIQRKWSQDLYDHILSLRVDTIGGRPIGEMVAIYTTDIPGATILLEQSLPQGFGIIFPLALAPFIIVYQFHTPILPTLAVIFTVVCINLFLANRQSRFFYRFKKLAADRLGLVNEWIQNIRTLRILGWTRFFEKKIFQVREIETENRISMLINGQFMNSLSSSITYILNLILILSLVYLSNEKVTPGALLSLLWIVAIFLTRPFRQMPWFFTFLFDGTSSLKRVAMLFTLENKIPNHTQVVDVKKDKNTHTALLIKKLNLSIKGEVILKDIDLEIRDQEFIAIVGEVGSGKSMLLLSLIGETGAEYDQYFIGDENVQKMQPDELRSHFSFVPQEGFIMSSTLRENVAFEYDVPKNQDDKIISSLDRAQFSLTQDRMTDGLNTEIGERGVNLSGGQKQRVNLARIDYTNSEIILLDDCLSAVDVDTEKKLLNSLFFGPWKNKTRILATHRLSVLEKVDRVVFMLNGKIEAVGHFNDLILNNSLFRKYTLSIQKEAQNENI